MPNQASRLPPKNPPTIPTRRLTRKPNPEPFINLPARKPANAPTITVNNVPNITISFNIIFLITNSLHLYCSKVVFLTICTRCSLRDYQLQAFWNWVASFNTVLLQHRYRIVTLHTNRKGCYNKPIRIQD